MSVPHLRVVSRTGAPEHARLPVLARELKRFRPEIRDGIAQLARRHVRLAELAQSFPALLVALAWPRMGVDVRPVIANVIAGAPLASLAAQARVPLWLRRMMPEMLIAPLPVLPDSAFVRHRIVNHLPRHPKRAANWFHAVSEANRWAHEELAVWMARAYSGEEKPVWKTVYGMERLCVWAWFSSQPQTRGHALIATPWTPQMQLKAAHAAADAWKEELDLELALGSKPVEDIWLRPASVDGLDFVPLLSASDLLDEATAMQNCVRTYGDIVADGTTRLWSVRRNGGRVATMEIARWEPNPVPFIRQLQLAGNQTPPPELWLAAHAWMQMQELPPIMSVLPRMTGRISAAAWRALWKPYWFARGIPEWLPLTPTAYGTDF